MSNLARIGDSVTGYCSNHKRNVSGIIDSGSSNVFCDKQSIARVGDTVIFDCGDSSTISTGSSILFINKIPAARIGDSVTGIVTGTIISGSSTTNVS